MRLYVLSCLPLTEVQLYLKGKWWQEGELEPMTKHGSKMTECTFHCNRLTMLLLQQTLEKIPEADLSFTTQTHYI